MTDYKLVPVKLTPHMGHAMDAVEDDGGSIQEIWEAGVNAAPAVQGERTGQDIQKAINSAPEALRALGEYLGRLLDEDRWPEAERKLEAAALAVQPDQSICDFYEATDYPSLVRELVGHVKQLQESAMRNVKPWEDTFPPTLLPSYIKRIESADADQNPAPDVAGLEDLLEDCKDAAEFAVGHSPRLGDQVMYEKLLERIDTALAAHRKQGGDR